MSDSWSVKAGDTMPAFQLANSDGKPFSSDDIKGKVAVIAIWATWCPPCRAELPVLDEKIYKPLHEKGAIVVGVNAGEESGEVEQFARKSKLTFPLIVDTDRKFSSAVGGQYLPRSLVVGKNGVIRSLHVGFDEAGADKLKAEVETLLAEK